MRVQFMNRVHQINKIQSMNLIHISNNESNSIRREVIFYESNSLTKLSSSFKVKTNKMNKIQTMKGNQTMKEIKDMNKTELVELINDLQVQIQDLTETKELQSNQILELQEQLKSASKDGRKSQVLEILKEHGPINIMSIAQKLNISTKNVSSQLTYLRSDGYRIFTDDNGKKFLVE